MNREIKFRIWLPSMRSMGLPFNPFDSHSEHVGYLKESVFMQYTGLKDKNGVGIYEGDILKTPAGVGEIKWDSCFRIYWNEKDNTTLHDVRVGHLEIIGNIFEHPELLKTT